MFTPLDRASCGDEPIQLWEYTASLVFKGIMIKTPLLAAEGFMILEIQIQGKKYALNQLPM
jgi:hypothetical protein